MSNSRTKEVSDFFSSSLPLPCSGTTAAREIGLLCYDRKIFSSTSILYIYISNSPPLQYLVCSFCCISRCPNVCNVINPDQPYDVSHFLTDLTCLPSVFVTNIYHGSCSDKIIYHWSHDYMNLIVIPNWPVVPTILLLNWQDAPVTSNLTVNFLALLTCETPFRFFSFYDEYNFHLI